jgi:beta-N-acetylhexosaminidase
MTISEELGQMLIFGWDVTANEYLVNGHAISLIDGMAVGGVVVEQRNMAPPRPLQVMLEELQIRAASCGLPPLFVAVDQEGGDESRLRPPFFRESRTPAEIGLTGDPSQARENARRMGDELKQIGFNMNLAPVLDVKTNPSNTLIRDRSFGADADVVSAMGAEATRGFQDDAGIMACGKHFPGHGGSVADRLLGLWHVRRSMKQLRSEDFAPFRSAVASGIAAIMVSHIIVTAIDAKRPATISKRAITDLLRGELGFNGLIVIDCVEAANLYTGCTLEEIVVRSILAGADIVFCCHEREAQIRVHNALVAAVEMGRITEHRIGESLARIRKAKQKWIVRRGV